MKHIILIVAIFATSFATAQNVDSLQWFTNIEKAKSAAAENEQNILMVFAGSDWCKPCIQFKKDILQNTNFATQNGQKLVVLYLDFPARKKNKLPKEQTKHNETLADQYNRSGTFPKIILLDAQGDKLKIIEFEGQSIEDFTTELSLTKTAK
ncbi:MAG: thioredoxin-related protein [Granulosicoccus sp.]|jgi:thioredoxin-related protein